jgi:uncharacterized protein YbcC (UPF0753/DUF2309 family)
MTDYYQTFKPQAEEAVKGLVKQRDDLRKQVDETQNKIVDEQDTVAWMQHQIDKLKVLAGVSLVEGHNSYETFQVSLCQRTLEYETLVEIVQTLQEEVLPQKEQELIDAERNLEHTLTVLCQNKKQVCEQKMTELIGQIIAEHDTWIEAWERLCADYGVAFERNKRGDLPEPRHPRLDQARPGFHIIALGIEERMACLKKSQEV